MRRAAAFLLATALAACARTGTAPPRTTPTPTPTPAPARDGAELIGSAELRRDLFAFADDSMRGRSATTADAARGARFIAERLARLGVEPAGDSGRGYLQRVPLVRAWVGDGSRFTVTTRAGASTRIPFGRALVPVLSFGDGAPLPALDAEGEVVFAGYGISSRSLGRDDLAGLSLEGKVVAFVDDAPASLDAARREAVMRDAPLDERLGAILRRHPAAVIVLAKGRLASALAVTAARLADTMLVVDSLHLGAAPARELPMVLVARAEPGSPFLPARWPADDGARALDARFAGHVDYHREEILTYNVVGVVRGSDPALRGSYVAFGAHLDHIGVQPSEGGDSIANGADDDGSGSVALLAIARAATRSGVRARRSFLFVWHTAEELGLYGSEWFTRHPTVPLDSVVAQLNADMIGRNAPDSLYIVGPLAAPNGQSRVLGAIVDSVNAAQPRPFRIDRDWDSPTHPEQMYYRSDHYNYARRGVPIVFFTTGLHADYHRPSDEPGKIDYAKLARVARLIWASGLAVADRGTPPRADAP